MSKLSHELFVHGMKGKLSEAQAALDHWLSHEPTEAHRAQVAQMMLRSLQHYLQRARRGAEEPFLHETADLIAQVSKEVGL